MAAAGARITAAVCAYNEAGNIGALLKTLTERDAHAFEELIVVSSGSTDGTDDIVRSFEGRAPDLRLIVETERRGKAAAVNTALAAATGDIVLLIDADCLPAEGALAALAAALNDPNIGGAGSRNVPVNGAESTVARAAAVLWELHHEVCLRAPVLGGDIVAFRRPGAGLPPGTVNDDYVIETAVRAGGRRIAYVPEARVFMRVPANLRDFLNQRRRIDAGYRAETARDAVKATQRPSLVLKAAWALLRRRPSTLPWLALLVMLEGLSRLGNLIDEKLRRRRYYGAWVPAASTKAPLPGDPVQE